MLTAYIVCSGAAGRGDVLFKGLLRVAGAAVGTVAAAGVAGTFGPRADATVVLMFIALAAATWLREFSYAYWAGIVTAVLSLLYGWFGQSAGALLDTRLAGILLGAALGIGASWLILPVRTGDVLRRRSADAVAALDDVLGADRSDPAALRRGQAAFEQSAGRLAAIAQPLLAQRLLLARWWSASGRRADAVDAIGQSADPVRLFVRAARSASGDDRVGDAVAAVRGNVTAIRRAIGKRPGEPYRPAVFAVDADSDINGADDLMSALRQIDAALGTLSASFSGASEGSAGDDDRRVVPGGVLELDVAGQQFAAKRFGERDVRGVVSTEGSPPSLVARGEDVVHGEFHRFPLAGDPGDDLGVDLGGSVVSRK